MEQTTFPSCNQTWKALKKTTDQVGTEISAEREKYKDCNKGYFEDSAVKRP